MRPIWKGHLTFGLVTIPVKLYTATEGKDVRFRLLHSSCMTPSQNKRYCPQHEQIVDWNDVVRGYEYAKGKFVPVSDEELDSVPLDTAGTVNVTSFADPHEIDPIYYEKSYYLAPDEGGQKAFRLLHDTMDETTKAAVGKDVIKEKDNLVAVRPHAGLRPCANGTADANLHNLHDPHNLPNHPNSIIDRDDRVDCVDCVDRVDCDGARLHRNVRLQLSRVERVLLPSRFAHW